MNNTIEMMLKIQNTGPPSRQVLAFIINNMSRPRSFTLLWLLSTELSSWQTFRGMIEQFG